MHRNVDQASGCHGSRRACLRDCWFVGLKLDANRVRFAFRASGNQLALCVYILPHRYDQQIGEVLVPGCFGMIGRW